jgi:hypothetical protein
MSFLMRDVVMKSSDLEWLRSAPFELASVRDARLRPSDVLGVSIWLWLTRLYAAAWQSPSSLRFAAYSI